MSKDNIFLKLKEVLLSEFELESDAISPGKRLYDDLELDSLDAVDLVIALKEHIQGKIDPALFKNARTVQDVVDILHPLWKTEAAN
ncbi:acyl carrier protein [Spirochaetia bacterium]|nr:acyl carrier protein [Spirochaetia bacterium]